MPAEVAAEQRLPPRDVYRPSMGDTAETFPQGVCDNAKPLAALRPTVSWLTYKDALGGKALPDAPTSREVRGKDKEHDRDDDDDDDRDGRGRHERR